jgi:hypothetical protein
MVTATAGAIVTVSGVTGAGMAVKASAAVRAFMVARASTEAAGPMATSTVATHSTAVADFAAATGVLMVEAGSMAVADPTAAAIDSR